MRIFKLAVSILATWLLVILMITFFPAQIGLMDSVNPKIKIEKPIINERRKLTPTEIYEKIRYAGIMFKNENYNMFGSGIIVSCPEISDAPFVISAGHNVFLPLTEKDKFWALFSDNQAPEEIELFIIDMYNQQDFAFFQFKNKEAALKFTTQAINLGSSADLKVGQSVFSYGVFIGTPFTFSIGAIVSLNMREALWERPQTLLVSAMTNYGSSGGALLNEFGELIGINRGVMFNQRGPGQEKVAMAPAVLYTSIPIDPIKETILKVKKVYGLKNKPFFVSHPLIRQIEVINSSENMTKELEKWGLERPTTEGVLVYDFTYKNSPAAKILRRGDRIISCNNKTINKVEDFYKEVFYCYSREMTVKLARDEEEIEVKVELIDTKWVQQQETMNRAINHLFELLMKKISPRQP